MSWRAALACWGGALLLAVAYVLSGPAEVEQAPLPRSPAAVASPGLPAYEVVRERIAAVEARRGDDVVRWTPAGAGWRIEAPPGAAIPAGVLDALVEQLVDGAVNERLDDARLSEQELGLARPSFTLRVEQVDGEAVTLVIGERTPTATALYGRVEETGTVFVAGLSLLTYADLLFAALR